MKKLLLILLCVPLIYSCGNTKNDDDITLNSSSKEKVLIEYDDLNNKGTLEEPTMYYNGYLFSGEAYVSQGSPLIPENTTAILSFKYGYLNGTSKLYYLNGQIMREVSYINNKRVDIDGEHKTYYENGQIESLETYKKNKRNGTAKSWHKNGKIRFEGNYLNGVLDENWKSWDEEGNEIERK